MKGAKLQKKKTIFIVESYPFNLIAQKVFYTQRSLRKDHRNPTSHLLSLYTLRYISLQTPCIIDTPINQDLTQNIKYKDPIHLNSQYQMFWGPVYAMYLPAPRELHWQHFWSPAQKHKIICVHHNMQVYSPILSLQKINQNKKKLTL